MNILGDSPIFYKKNDTLERCGYAEHIAKGILNWKSKESLCLALHGPWGSGKTSLLNLCLENIKEQTKDLEKNQKPIIIQFQPWIISGQEQLIRTFINQLRMTLGKPELSQFAHEAATRLEVYEKIFDVASKIPFPTGGILGQARDWIATFRKSAQAAEKQLENDLDSNKEAICEALSKLPAPVIITIDDVDRLTSEEIRQLFQLIKAVADFPNTVYILAFDHALVEKALEPFQCGSETRYLEKIIQLDFEVPNPSQIKITSVLWDGLADSLKSLSLDKSEQSRWNESRFGPFPLLFKNIRDVKRYSNSVNFIFPLMQNEVSTEDIFLMEAIHVFAPDLYKVVKNNKVFLVSDSPYAGRHGAKDKEREQWIKSLPELAPKKIQKEIQELLILIFPEVETVFKNHGWSDSFMDTWNRNKRICRSSYFEFYFRGMVMEGEISSKELDKIFEQITNFDNLVALLVKYMSDENIKSFLLKIEERFKESHDPELAEIIIASGIFLRV